MRNKDRLPSVPENDNSQKPPPLMPQEPEMRWVVPTRWVELPSHGKFYPNGHILHGRESVELREMNTPDLNVLASKALRKQGETMDALLSKLLMDKNIISRDFLVGDRNALFVAIRTAGISAEYAVKIVCSTCNSTGPPVKFDLNKCKIVADENEYKHYEVEHLGGALFSAVLPRVKAKVEFRFLDGHDEKEQYELSKFRQKKNLEEEPYTDRMRAMIQSVDGDTSEATINEFINHYFPSFDFCYLQNLYDCILPNMDVREQFVCTSCGYEEEISPPLRGDFFFPGNK